jgi:hypothetical protein
MEFFKGVSEKSAEYIKDTPSSVKALKSQA